MEYFMSDKKTKKERKAEANRKYYLANREKKTKKRNRTEYMRKWRLANSDYQKEWRLANSDYHKEYNRKRYLANKDRLAEYNRETSKTWYLNNKDKKFKYNKIYNLKNKDKIHEYRKVYQQSEVGKKSSRISRWKKYGIKDFNIIKYILSEKFPSLGTGFYNDNFNTIHRIFTIQKICSVCYKTFDTENQIDWKCIDHEHQNGYMRRICCNVCNLTVIK